LCHEENRAVAETIPGISSSHKDFSTIRIFQLSHPEHRPQLLRFLFPLLRRSRRLNFSGFLPETENFFRRWLKNRQGSVGRTSYAFALFLFATAIPKLPKCMYRS
jgi:hypothetical protein